MYIRKFKGHALVVGFEVAWFQTSPPSAVPVHVARKTVIISYTLPGISHVTFWNHLKLKQPFGTFWYIDVSGFTKLTVKELDKNFRCKPPSEDEYTAAIVHVNNPGAVFGISSRSPSRNNYQS